MGLIDLSHELSKGYKWILHLKDHFSKMTWLWPLKLKQYVGISKCLNSFMRHCGPPKMIQCDNGKELKGAVTRLIRKHGPKMINGSPENPQQGLIKKANGVVRKKIIEWKNENKQAD